jgi:pimeloyl-ACP methyl ester carboxylesterase
MDRRHVLRFLGGVGLAGAVPGFRSTILDAQTPQWPSLTLHGRGAGLPLVIMQGGNTEFTPETVGPLAENRRVALIDLTPPASMPAEDHTADRVCRDILAAVTAAGIDRFAWYGCSFGAVVGLQVATRSDRVRALICGGWPPLDAQYRETLAVTEANAAKGLGTRHGFVFYRSLQGWPERDAVTRLTCARLAFAGTDDQFTVQGHHIHIGPTLNEHRRELEQLGWQVTLIDGFRHNLGSRLDVIAPLIRDFLALQTN